MRLLERHFRVLPDGPGIYQEWKALVLAHKVTGVQAHDARLVAAMNVHGVTRILTINVTDFSRHPGITAFAPTDIT